MLRAEIAHDAADEDVLALAHAQSRVLSSLDKDFGELAILRSKPHCGIIRFIDIAARDQGPTCEQLLNRFEFDLKNSAIITVINGRIRIRQS